VTVEAVPNQPLPEYGRISKFSQFKIADPQYIISQDPASTIEDMEYALLQNIGGHEIISIVRRDLVDGKNTNYTLISNLQKLFNEYNPKTIISMEDSSNIYFKSFGILFEKYVPSQNALSKISSGLINPINVDADNNIIIYVSNIEDSYEVEVQSISSQESFRDTIYEGL
jgi:hypothetical protein